MIIILIYFFRYGLAIAVGYHQRLLTTPVLIVVGLYSINYLSLITAVSFVVAIIKFGIVNFVLDWYRQARFQFIAIFETRFALVYIAYACISVLPAHLPPG